MTDLTLTREPPLAVEPAGCSPGATLLPHLSDRLARVAPFSGTEEERWAVQQAYALMPRANFSRSILEPCPASLAVSKLPAVTWSDLGTPRRVQSVL